jgi:hypothetical protein
MKTLFSIGALCTALLALSTGAFAQSSSSAESLPCGPLTMMCVRGTQAQCVDHHWQCLPAAEVSSSSVSSSSAGADRCVAFCPDGYSYRTCTEDGHPINYFADPCMNHYTVSSVSSRSSSSSSVSSVSACNGPNRLLCMRDSDPRCVNGQWTCVPHASSSSVSSSSSGTVSGCSGANNLFCIRGTSPACVNGHWSCVAPGSSSSSVAAVHISSLRPDSGKTGRRVTITGTGFSRTGNAVQFADSVLPDIRSPDGKHLTFRVPSQTTQPCFYTTPACYMAIRLYTPGPYQVSVRTQNGAVSNALTYTVTAAR